MNVRGTRTCPLPFHDCDPPGCRFCGKPVESARGARWHRECVDTYHLANHPARSRPALVERDGPGCWLCGADPMRWKASPEYYGRDGIYREVERVTALQVDHVIPLWSVRHLEPRIRVLYFLLMNLILLCPDCHKAKSKREAGRKDHPSRDPSVSRARPKRKPADR